MKTLVSKIALAVALVVPAVASAYSGNTDTDTYTFTIGGSGLYNVSIGATWDDLYLKRDNRSNRYMDATTLKWTFDGGAPVSFVSDDTSAVNGGSNTLSFNNVLAGVAHTLVLTGIWGNGTTPNGYELGRRGDVNLLDGDRINGEGRNQFEANTFLATPVAAVPEPETYAMMLAGLMMMGTIARRRNRTK
jgi:hypothetical protein